MLWNLTSMEEEVTSEILTICGAQAAMGNLVGSWPFSDITQRPENGGFRT
jgi:hypothetical protein